MLNAMIAFIVNGGRLCAAFIAVQRSASTIPLRTYSTISMMMPATMPPIITRPRLIFPMVSPSVLRLDADATHASPEPRAYRPVLRHEKTRPQPRVRIRDCRRHDNSILHAYADREEAADDPRLVVGWIVVDAGVVGRIERRPGVEQVLDSAEQFDIGAELVPARQVEIPERIHAAVCAERVEAVRQRGRIWPGDILTIFVKAAHVVETT